METLRQDLRYAVRTLWRARGFTAAAVLTLALGIGANTAIFSVVDGVLLRPAPFPGIDRLMMVWETDRKGGTTREPSSIPDFTDFQQRSTQFSSLAAFIATEVTVSRGEGDPGRLAALAVSPAFVPLTGTRPLVGRLLSDYESRAGGPQSVLISEALWESDFARSPSVIGSHIRLDDQEWTIVGVMPRSADFGTLQMLKHADYGRSFSERGDRTRVDVWMGLRPSPTASRDNHPIIVVGKLAPGATRVTAQTEMATITADLERAYPSNAARGAFVEPIEDVIFGDVRPALLVLLASVGLVLLVACGNVANLLLARGAARMREVTVRVALGAGTGRLARQFMTESALLTGMGATLGVLLAYAGLSSMLALAPSSLPRIDDVGIDVRVLAVTLGASVLVALVFGALPLFQSRRRDLHGALQGQSGRGASGGRMQGRLRSSLVVAELAMAVTLMTGAGVLMKSLWQLRQVDPGFRSSGVWKAEFQLPASRYPQDRRAFPEWPNQQRFYAELEARIGALPGVTGVAVAAANPLDAGFTSSIVVVGREAESVDFPEPSIRTVSASYFPTMRVPVSAGRAFEVTDTPRGAPVVLINESALQRFFGGRAAVGQRIRLWGADRTIVGVVGNEHFKGIAQAAPPAVYLPVTQAPIANAVLVRTSGAPDRMASALRGVVRDLDPLLPLFGVEPLEQTLSNSVGEQRFTVLALGAFAAIALLLAALGVHGVLSYTVAQRTREIGIRIALGANPARVRSGVVANGALLAATGLAIGLACSLAVTRALSSLLFGVGPRDPTTFAAVALTLGAVALVASYLPARRASLVEPMVALRSD